LVSGVVDCSAFIRNAYEYVTGCFEPNDSKVCFNSQFNEVMKGAE